MKSAVTAAESPVSGASSAPPTPILVQELRDVSALAEMAGAVAAARKPQALLKLLAVRAARACAMERCSIFLCQGESLVPAMAQLASGLAKPDEWAAFKALGPLALRDSEPVARAIAIRNVVRVDHVRKCMPRAWVERFSPAALLIAPLFRRRRLLGVMVLDNSGSPPITDTQVGRARAVADSVGAALGAALATAETRQRLRATETLLNVGHAIGSTLELPEVARRITREAARALGADSAGIYLADGSGTSLQPFAAYHMPRRLLDAIQKERIVLREVPEIFNGTRASDDVPNDPTFSHEIFRKFPMQSLVAVPLRAKQRAVGILVCAWWTKRRRLSWEEIRLIEGIATQAAMAIVNANLYSEAEELAVSRERMRMTHELHDTLSRVLFSIALKVDWCLQRLPAGSDLKPHVEAIKQEARTMMAHLRRVIQHLASAEDGAGGLARLIQEFQDLSGIPVLFVEHGDLSHLDDQRRDLLERTIREALANVVKHARASRVELRVELAAGMVEFEVADDGVGVCRDRDRDVTAWGHYGIRQMRDRLLAAGGDLELHANAPSGLRLKGRFPGR